MIMRAEVCADLAEAGGKAMRLAALRSAGFPVPEFFVLPSRAFDVAQSADFLPAAEVCADLTRAVRELCPDAARVAVRSSGQDEDDGGHSFAGQFESFLCVSPAKVSEKVAAVWRSGFSERIAAYRRAHGLPISNQPPAVIVQRQLNPDVAGVAFSADPISGQRSVAVVAATYGLGTTVVSGRCTGDTFRVSRDGDILERNLVLKVDAERCAPEGEIGVRVFPVMEPQSSSPALNDEQVREVATLARRSARHFGVPQDVEWAVEDGRLYLLQSRPVTALRLVADPEAVPTLWDNSNVSESYGGITLPLTFSFARHVYEEVYREFCRMVGVSKRVIAVHDDTFARMLGLVQGRVYYNLLSWYRLLATLPGFTLNRRFMEQMMGVAEGVPDHILGARGSATTGAKLRDAVRLARTTVGLVTSYILLPSRTRWFQQRLDGALEHGANLQEASADELVAYYRLLEQKLLKRWDAPLINDFFAMIFYGVLRRLSQTWCDDREASLQNDLIAGEGGMVSTEPARRVREMAQAASADPKLVAALRERPLADIADIIRQTPAFRALYEDYLEKFGDRCFEELKLESPTVGDNPLTLLRSVGELASPEVIAGASGDVRHAGQSSRPDPNALRARAEARVRGLLKHRPHRRLIFQWVLDQARARVRDRENLRFERTRVFGRVRRIFRALGQQFEALGVLVRADDVFYLHVDEVLGFVEGTTVSTDLKGLVALRKAEYERHQKSPPPDHRFETRGIVHVGNTFRRSRASESPGADQRQGIGCCPGIVEGCVDVVLDPRQALPKEGAILVAERTDPAWVMLFSTAAGLLVERGSLLSHSAIIAREMGIPTIVAVPEVTRWLRTGDRVWLDGRTGVVRRLGVEEETGHAG